MIYEVGIKICERQNEEPARSAVFYTQKAKLRADFLCIFVSSSKTYDLHVMTNVSVIWVNAGQYESCNSLFTGNFY